MQDPNLPSMNEQRAGVPTVIAVAIGMGLWFAVSLAVGRREAWDTSAYWTVAYPVALVACAVLGFVFPQKPWRWPVVPRFTVLMVMSNVAAATGRV